MNIKSVEKKEKGVSTLLVEVTAEEFDAAVNKAFIKNKSQISVPGFRKGKVPRKIVERMYGASAFHSEALDIILPSVLEFIVAESEIKIVGDPKVTDIDMEDDAANGVKFTIDVGEYPEVELGEYKGLSAPKPAVSVSDEDVGTEVEAIRVRNARIEKVERPAAIGDITVIDYEGFIDGEPFEGGKGENYELQLGTNTLIPGFEEKLQGMSVGDERDIDLVFPDNYKESLAGKPVTFKVKLNELREKILPDLDDEFAKDVSEFDTLDEYRDSIRNRFLSDRQKDADSVFENALIAKVIENMKGDIPDVMIDSMFKEAMENFSMQVSAYGMDLETYLRVTKTTPEGLRESMRVSSERRVKSSLALEKIAQLEGIEVSEEEIEDEYRKEAEQYNIEPDKVKERVERDAIVREIKFTRALKIITDSAIATEPEPEPEAESESEPGSEPAEDGQKDDNSDGQKTKAADKKTAGKTSDKKAAQEKAPDADDSPQKPAAVKKTAARKTDAVNSETVKQSVKDGGDEEPAEPETDSEKETV